MYKAIKKKRQYYNESPDILNTRIQSLSIGGFRSDGQQFYRYEQNEQPSRSSKN